MKFNIIIFLALIIIFLAVSGLQSCQQSNELIECRTDADCVKTQTTCCPCSSGGEEKCLSKLVAEEFQENLSLNCHPENELVCIALFNCKIEKCLCIDGKCIEEKNE